MTKEEFAEKAESAFAITIPKTIPLAQIMVILFAIVSMYDAMRDIQESSRQNTLLIKQVQENQVDIVEYRNDLREKLGQVKDKANENSSKILQMQKNQELVNEYHDRLHAKFEDYIALKP